MRDLLIQHRADFHRAFDLILVGVARFPGPWVYRPPVGQVDLVADVRGVVRVGFCYFHYCDLHGIVGW